MRVPKVGDKIKVLRPGRGLDEKFVGTEQEVKLADENTFRVGENIDRGWLSKFYEGGQWVFVDEENNCIVCEQMGRTEPCNGSSVHAKVTERYLQKMSEEAKNDSVSHPSHYTSSPAKCLCGKGIECIQVTEHMGFNLGNAVKYIWRADLKGNAIEDLHKAAWYIQREIEKREKNG